MFKETPLVLHFMAAILLVFVLPIVVPSNVLATEILIFALAAIGCNLLLGYTGLLSFGQALFFGAGAYIASLMSIHWTIDLLSILLITVFLGGAIAIVVGYFSIRRHGIYFVMLTLAFAQLGYYIAYLAEPITGGEDGLLDVHRPALVIPFLAKFHFGNDLSFYVLVAVIFVLMFTLMQRLVSSPFGSVLVAIKQNEARAEAIGYQVRLYKIAVFAFSGAITALSGALYAFMLNFAPLSNIDIETSEHILFMCVLGGLGSLYGSIVGTIIFLLSSEMLAELWPRWMLLLGVLLIVVMLYLPGGVWKAITDFFERLFGKKNKEKGGKHV
ncbi:MAG: branched-chain amino acid ABC transporter permease [Arenicella sp.]